MDIKSLKQHFPMAAAVGRRVRRNLAPTGKIFVVTLAWSSLWILAFGSVVNQLFWSVLTLLLVAAALAFVVRPRPTVRVLQPRTVEQFHPFAVTYELVNETYRSNFDLTLSVKLGREALHRVELQQGAMPIRVLPAGSSTVRSLRFRPLRRGVLTLPRMTVISHFPFQIFRTLFDLPKTASILVTPRFSPITEPLKLSSELSGVGELESLRHGQADQLLSNREYLPGMYVRRWNYQAWARLNRPIVREFASYRPSVTAILIDTSLPGGSVSDETELMPSKSTDRFEGRVSFAAAIAENLTRHDQSIAYLLTSDGSLLSSVEIQSRGFSAILEFLACAESYQATQPETVGMQTASETMEVSNATVSTSRFASIRRLRPKPSQAVLISDDREMQEAVRELCRELGIGCVDGSALPGYQSAIELHDTSRSALRNLSDDDPHARADRVRLQRSGQTL